MCSSPCTASLVDLKTNDDLNPGVKQGDKKPESSDRADKIEDKIKAIKAWSSIFKSKDKNEMNDKSLDKTFTKNDESDKDKKPKSDKIHARIDKKRKNDDTTTSTHIIPGK